MQNERLFCYSVLFHPTKKEREDSNARSQLIVPPTAWKLYPNEAAAQIEAMRDNRITQEHLDNSDRLEVAVSGF